MDLNGDLSQTQILVHCDGFAVRRMGRGSRLRRVFLEFRCQSPETRSFGTVFWSLCVAPPQAGWVADAKLRKFQLKWVKTIFCVNFS